MDWGLIFILIIVGLIIFWIVMSDVVAREQKAKRESDAAVLEIRKKEFQPQVERFEAELDEKWPVRHVREPSWRERAYLMMSGDQKRLASVRLKLREEVITEWEYDIALSSIVSVELQQEEKTIMRLETTGITKKSGSLGRAAVGGVLFGGAGAIVGAASAGSTSVQTTTSKSETLKGPVYLVIGTIDMMHPLHKTRMGSRAEAENWLHRIRGGIALLARESV